ncbi:ankyrin repeat-containing domain protein [Leptodontidium sp. MPI-SDFR-AT-0119]|nr:ankyrin repeat-containing domain protein [Leptodontidium sp. MPI-SDFR-AT-0119]
MHILDLSIELVRDILEQAVMEVGLTAAVKLRLVCQKGTLNKEIPVAMLNARLLEIEHRWLFFVPTLVSKSISSQSLEAESWDAALEPYIRKLSHAAAWNMDTRSILHYIQPNTSTEQKYLGHKSITNNVEAAAAHLGDLEFFTRLTSNPGDIDASENMYFGNPLRKAILQGHYELTKFLLEHGVNVNHGEWGKGFSGTALQAAASTGQRRFVDLILKFRNLILMEGAKNGRGDVVKFSLEMGAGVNEGEGRNCWQLPITEAARRGHAGIVRMLLENGAVVRVYGRQSTIAAATRGSGWESVVRVLLEYMNEEDVKRSVELNENCARWIGLVSSERGTQAKAGST